MYRIVTTMRKITASGYSSFLSFMAGILALLLPALPMLTTVIIFILTDAYYGYQVSKKYGCKLESKKLWKTCIKLKDTFTVVILGLLLDKTIFMTYPDLVAAKVAAGTICISEAISLLESFRTLHPNALLSKILAKLIKSKAEKYLEVDLSDVIDLKEFTNDTKSNKNNNK